jgi:PKD repeat protein
MALIFSLGFVSLSQAEEACNKRLLQLYDDFDHGDIHRHWWPAGDGEYAIENQQAKLTVVPSETLRSVWLGLDPNVQSPQVIGADLTLDPSSTVSAPQNGIGIRLDGIFFSDGVSDIVASMGVDKKILTEGPQEIIAIHIFRKGDEITGHISTDIVPWHVVRVHDGKQHTFRLAWDGKSIFFVVDGEKVFEYSPKIAHPALAPEVKINAFAFPESSIVSYVDNVYFGNDAAAKETDQCPPAPIGVAPIIEPIAENKAPYALFTAIPNFGEAPIEVKFDASTSFDPNGRIVYYQWNSSDGQKTLGMTPTLTFNTVGTHTITLTVTDNDGSTAIAEQTIVVTEPEAGSLIPDFTVTPYRGIPPLTVHVDASAATGAISQYDWSTTDGQSFQGMKKKFTFTQSGIQVITLTVTDNHAVTASTEKTVILQSPPVAKFVTIPTIVTLSKPTAQLDASTSFDTDGQVVDYTWTVSAGEGEIVGEGEKPTITFPKREGDYQISLVVTDNEGLSSYTVTKVVKVISDTGSLPPVAIIDVDEKYAMSRIARLSAERSVDIDGEIQSYQWHISPMDETMTGKVIDLTFSEDGDYLITLTVTDNQGLTGKEEQTLSVGEQVSLEFVGLKDDYSLGEWLKVDLVENVKLKSRFEQVDLWMAIQLPNNGGLLFKTAIPMQPFSPYPQAFRESLQEVELSHRFLDFEVIPGIGGIYTIYAVYVKTGENPMNYLENLKPIQRSNFVIQSTTLAN